MYKGIWCMHMHTCAEVIGQFWCLPQSLSTLVFLRQTLPLNLELSERQDSPVGEFQESSCLCFPNAKITGRTLCSAFYVGVGIELRSLCVSRWHFTDRPVPQVLIKLYIPLKHDQRVHRGQREPIK